MLFIDFQKDFDSVEWEFVLKVLKHSASVQISFAGSGPFAKIYQAVL